MTHFASVVGDENVSSARADLVAYSTDASQIFGEAEMVVWPSDAEQVHKIILYAKRAGLNLVPRGGGTNLVGSAVPDKSVVLDLSRMNRVLSVSIPDLYVVVEPGVVVADLNRHLAKHNLFFPVIPSSENVATVGGMISTNAAGLRAVKYGRMVDWVLELSVIDGTGKQFVMKGTDIADFAGSEGMLGIITSAKLKLTTPFAVTTAEIFGFDTVDALMVKLVELKDYPVSMLEFFDKAMARLLGLDAKYCLVVEFEGDYGNIKDGKEIAKALKLREDAYPVAAANGFPVIEDPKIDIERLPELVKWLEANKLPCTGHVGIGVMHPMFVDDKKLDEFYKFVLGIGGSLTGEHGIGLRKRAFASSEFVSNMKKLKQRFDPDRLLNRGKIV